MSFVIRCHGLASDGSGPIGSMLQSYDPDANNGWGDAEWTDRLEDALKFDDAVDAWELWRRTSAIRPMRADGRPNRPLTAFSVSVEAVK